MKLCALFIMTHVGAPMIYYGDQEVEHNYTIHTTQIKAKDYITEKTYELTNGNVFIKLARYEAAVIVYNI